jgi:U3 small nucleolar RNA-associated protein 10
MVIRVFVDASPHVPEHRRLPVFSHLVSTVGASRFLHVTLTLLVERYVVHSKESEEDEVSQYSQVIFLLNVTSQIVLY